MAAYYWTTLASLAALLSTQHQKMLGKCTKLSKTIGSHFIMSVIFCNCCTRHVSIFLGGTKLGFMVRNKTTIIHPHQAKHSKSRLIWSQHKNTPRVYEPSSATRQQSAKSKYRQKTFSKFHNYTRPYVGYLHST